PLTLGEMRMLVELFYLPYHHGPLAQHLLEHFWWLQANSLSVGVPATAPDACGGTWWHNRAQSFQLLCAQTCRLHSRFVSSAGQALLYDLHPYLWDIRNMLLAASAFVLWLGIGCQSITAPILPGGDAEPWARRGGLFGELQALLPVGNSCDLFYHPPPPIISLQLWALPEPVEVHLQISPFLKLPSSLQDDSPLGRQQPLSAVTCLLPAPPLCLTSQQFDEMGRESVLQQRDSSWLPAIRHKYPQDLGADAPALGQDALEEALLFFHAEPPAVPLPVLQRFPSLVQLLDVGAGRSLAICLLSALRANGSRGVFCEVSAADWQQLSFYSKLG
ncbi:Bifunctional protein NCOAT, partial [Phaethon lepturus]